MFANAYRFVMDVLTIILIVCGGYFTGYYIFSKICNEHKKLLYYIMVGFVIGSVILGFKNMDTMILLCALYYIVCGIIYYKCRREHKKAAQQETIEEPKEEDTDV